jgi:hypothetical protein
VAGFTQQLCQKVVAFHMECRLKFVSSALEKSRSPNIRSGKSVLIGKRRKLFRQTSWRKIIRTNAVFLFIFAIDPAATSDTASECADFTEYPTLSVF